MDFDQSPENTMIRDAIEDWVSKECTRELVATMDEEGSFPSQLLSELGILGFSGILIPEQYGGGGGNYLAACLVAEELSRSYSVLASGYLGVSFFGGAIINTLGSEAQKRQYLEPIASGSMLTALAFAEPEGESAEHITSVAKCRGEQFIINGSKSHVQLADQAELLLVLARTAESESERGLTLFCVDVRTEGVEILPVDTMGQRGANRCRVRFNNVQVTADNILGGIQKMGEARQQLGTLQNIVQIAYAACGIGLARGAFEYALQYAGEREQFGQTIVRFPAIAQMLAEVESKTEAARLMLYKAAWMLDMDKDCQREVSMALTLGTEVSVKAAMDGLQILGGYGYTMEYDIQRFVRDSAAMLSMGKRLDALNGQIARRYTL